MMPFPVYSKTEWIERVAIYTTVPITVAARSKAVFLNRRALASIRPGPRLIEKKITGPRGVTKVENR
jgi:hypothetical protein